MPRLVRGPTTHAAPSTYALAPNEAFIPEAVTATFVGTGATDSFMPTLSIYAQSGELLARCPASTVSAGDSAEVTFAPLLRAAAAAAAATATEWCAIGFSGPVNLPSQVAGLSTKLTFDEFDLLVTNAPDTFKLELYDPGGGGTPYWGVRVYTPGYYRLEMTLNLVDSAASPVANPETVPVYAENSGGNVTDEVAVLGSLYNVGYTRAGRSRWDVFFWKPVGIGANSGAFPPTVVQAQQNSGVTLAASTAIFMSSLPDPV